MSVGRRYSDWVTLDVQRHLDALLRTAEQHDTEGYRSAMRTLGHDLGKRLVPQLPATGTVILVCTVEDADFLGTGVLEEVVQTSTANVFCYWNDRDASRDVAPIISRYEEPIDETSVSAVVVVKSVISGACVVRTNLIEVLDRLQRDVPVFVLAPVMHTNAKEKLNREFPPKVASRFEYITGAVDEEKDGENIRPGIGGSVYELLGLGDKQSKNRFRPKLLADRSRLFAR